jgi:uncharacterized protein
MFLDTSGLFSLFDDSDQYHAEALRLIENSTKLLTTNYVLVEFIALANARKMPRRLAQAFISDIISDKAVNIFWVDEQSHSSAMLFLSRRLDKDYSLCDAVSFLQMMTNGEREVLTTDRHFEQEGFIRLLR